MEVFKTLKPNAPGTKRLTRVCGDSLVAVRYRKGSNPDNIYTTVELVVESKPYLPGITHAPAKTARQYQKVPLNIGYYETDLRQAVKEAGAFWDMKQKVWFLTYGKVCELKLKDRIIKIFGVRIWTCYVHI